VRILLVSVNSYVQKVIYVIGSFDSTVHISEEASNAATAVPWAIVWAISIAGVSGLGTPPITLVRVASYLVHLRRSGERSARILHGPRSRRFGEQ
jgi:hypothetical protein